MEALCLKAVGDDTCKLLSDHLVPCSADPDGGWITVPTEPFSRITTNLWQGGSYLYDPAELSDFQAVLTVNGRARRAPEGVDEFLCFFADAPVLPDMERLMLGVDWAYANWRQGRRTLVRCQGGLNRSGLVIALMLYKHGWDVDDAITRIRERRSPYALCNATFEQYLRALT